MFKTPKLAKKTLWFFQKELTHDFESKFESCIFCNSCLDRVRRHDDTNKQTNDCKACWMKMDNQKGIVYPLAWLLYPTVTCNRTTFPLLVRPLQSFLAQHEKNYAKNHACTTNGIPVKQWLCHLLLHEALGRHVTGIQEPDWNKCYAMGKHYLFTKVRESVRETFLQIIQKPWATNTWDLDKLFIYWSFITFHFHGFFHWTVSNLFCVTMIPWFLMISVILNSVNQQCFGINWNSYSLYSNP